MLDIAKEAQRLSEETFARLWREKYAPLAREIAEEDASRRCADYVDSVHQIGPWHLRPLTLRDVLLCEGHENPLIGPEALALSLAKPEHLWWLCWQLQPLEIREDTETRDRFIDSMALRHFEHRRRRRLLRRGVMENTGLLTAAWFSDLAAVVDFVAQHFADAGTAVKVDPQTGRPRPARDSGTHWIAGIVDAFAAEYGWREAEVLDLHLGRVWQYLRRMEHRRDPQALIPSRVKALRGECLAEVDAIVREQIAALIKPASAS